MAYNNYYPNYQTMYPQYQSPYQPIQPNATPTPTPAQQPMQIQNGGFIQVHNEMEARNYPIAPGNSVTFKDENAPYVYTKTMGFSQLDRPIFEKFRLVKEEIAQEQPQNASVNATNNQPVNLSDYATKAELGAVLGELDTLKADFEKLTPKKQPAKSKKEEANNDE